MIIEVEDLRRRMARLPAERLIEIVTTDRRAYRAVAVELAAAELARRGVAPAQTTTTAAPNGATGRRRRVAQTSAPPGADGFVQFCEVVCAVVGSIVLAAVFVAERQTQKTVLRWAATSLALPYAVWRAGRFLDRRFAPGQPSN
jgi:hypothetical protein